MNKDTYIEYLKGRNHDIYYYWDNIENELKDKIDLLISYYQKELEFKNAELSAKVYTYEKIIANSNFAPILEEKNIRRNKGEKQ